MTHKVFDPCGFLDTMEEVVGAFQWQDFQGRDEVF